MCISEKMRNRLYIYITLALALMPLRGALAQNKGRAKTSQQKSGPVVKTTPLAQIKISAAAVDSTTDASIIDAVQLYTQRNYPEALKALSSILSDSPKNDAAWYYKALCEMYQDNAPQAIKDLKTAATIDSTNYWYRVTLAGMYEALGEKELAIGEYEKITKAFPKKTDVYYDLVNLYISDGKLDKAIEVIDEIETVQGKSDPTVMTKYRILLQQQKPEEAHKVLKDFNDEYSSPQVLSMLGDYEMGMYNDSTALSYYDEALSLDRDYAPARIGKAEAFRMTRKYPQFFEVLGGIMKSDAIPSNAKADYLQALTQHTDSRFLGTFKAQLDSTFATGMEHHPADTSMLKAAGLYYYATGRVGEAANIFKKNMEVNAESVQATGMYLQMLAYSSQWKELAKESTEAFERFPKVPDFLELANTGYYNLKDYKSIISNCERIIEKAQGDTSITIPALSNMGDMYHQIGEVSKAYKCYDKVLAVNPNYAPVLNNYAWFLAISGKSLSKAYKMSKRTIELEPDNATYLDTFGWILHLQGKDLEAKPFFKHAMLYGAKDSATSLEHYSVVLESLGETDLAEVYRKQAAAKAEKEAE